MKPTYPNLPQSWGIFGIAILASICFSFVNFGLVDYLSKEVSMLIYYVLSMGSCLLFAHLLRKKENKTSEYRFSTPKLRSTFLIVIMLLSLQIGITMPLSSLIPMPDMFKQMFMELADLHGWAAFLTIAIAAPILEEFIFRGIILDGLLKNYSAKKAIFWSSFLFALVHMNPWQFISAMDIGLFSAWVYYRTSNLLLCIIIHFANNGIAFGVMEIWDSVDMIDINIIDFYGGPIAATLLISSCLLISMVCFFILNRILPRTVKWQFNRHLNESDREQIN